MRYQVRHRTTYLYQDQVTIGYNELFLTPRETPWQRLIEHRIVVTPTPSIMRDHADFFGNTATYVEVHTLHSRFEVELQAQVEVLERPPVPDSPPWEAVVAEVGSMAGLPVSDVLPFIHPSTYVTLSPAVLAFALSSFPAGRPILEAAQDLMHRIYREFKFQSGTTTIGTPQDEVLRLRKGVCQDFAHLQVACLRALRLPARYVSGYLMTTPPPGQPRMVGADASHAWLSVYGGAEAGWIDLDPTNDCVPGTKHVTLAWGLDYRDVSPVRGIVLGGGDHRLDFGVDVAPIGA
jgi:transglutaminase-like putative cysteine protease